MIPSMAGSILLVVSAGPRARATSFVLSATVACEHIIGFSADGRRPARAAGWVGGRGKGLAWRTKRVAMSSICSSSVYNFRGSTAAHAIRVRSLSPSAAQAHDSVALRNKYAGRKRGRNGRG
jgi:hypothetical protein